MFYKIYYLDIPGPKHVVWQKIADKLNKNHNAKITAASIRVHVAFNRNDLKSKLGILPPIDLNYSSKVTDIGKQNN